MKRALWFILAVAVVSGVATAGQIDFASLPAGQEINILSPFFTGISQVGDPGVVNFTYIADAGTPCAYALDSGYAYDGTCIGASADQAGIFGTTDGYLSIDFPQTAYALQFNYGVFTFMAVPPPPDQFGAAGLFTFLPTDTPGIGAATGDANTFTYVSSTGFRHADLYFSPAAQNIDPNTQQLIYGESLFTISDMNYSSAPEPGAFALLGFGLLGIGYLGKRKR
jgi:hypothetical protein